MIEIDKITIEKIKKDLIKRKGQLVRDLEHIAKKSNDSGEDEYRATFPEYGNKIDENAQEINEYSTNIAQEDILEKTLRDIEKSLKNIENGTYGTCKYCKNPINPKRLEARPTASSCVDCKTKLQNS